MNGRPKLEAEARNARMQLLVTQNFKDKLKITAMAEGTSVNSLIIDVMSKYMEENKEHITDFEKTYMELQKKVGKK